MKKNSFIYWIVLLFTLPIWSGCNNEMDEKGSSTEKYSGEPIPIQLFVKGIENGIDTRAAVNKMVFSQPLDKDYDTGYDLVTTVEATGIVQTRANSVLANVKYRLLAYKGTISTANYAGQGNYVTDAMGVATAEGTQLYLPAGTYTFVCYSYNKNEVIAAFDGTGTLLPVAQGDDFITCIQNNVTVEADATGEFILDNVFTRHSTQVTLEVSAAGYANNTINACAATMQTMNDNTLSWNFATSTTLPNTGTSGSVDFVWTTLNDTVVTSTSRLVLPISQRNLSVALTSLTIGTDILANSTVDLSDVVLQSGYNYKISIALERNFIPVGNFKWAKGNLYKSGADYLFEATQDGNHPGLTGGSYFDWNSSDVGLGTFNDGVYDVAKDPCAGVAPTGTWITPNIDAVSALITNKVWDTSGTINGYWFGTAPYRVFLPAYGVRSPDYPPSIVGNDGLMAYYSLRDHSVGNNFYCAALSFEEGGAFIMEDSSRTLGYLIRCVKAQ